MNKNLTQIIFVLLMLAAGVSQAQVDTFTVTKTTDFDPFLYQDNPDDTAIVGTLQWAIRKSNDAVNPCVIVFNIPVTSQQTINLIYQLPYLNNEITIDATTQKGYMQGIPAITINGNYTRGVCFYIIYNNCKIKGCYIKNFTFSGIFVLGVNGFTIENNVINRIAISTGKPCPIPASGITLNNCTNGTVRANIIGTDVTLSTGLEIRDWGIWRQGIVHNCMIGGNSTDDGNIIAYCTAGLNQFSGCNQYKKNRFIGNNKAFANISNRCAELLMPVPVLFDTYTSTGFTSGTAHPGSTIDIFGLSDLSNNANEYLTSAVAGNNGNWAANVLIQYPYLRGIETDVMNCSSILSDHIEKQNILVEWNFPVNPDNSNVDIYSGTPDNSAMKITCSQQIAYTYIGNSTYSAGASKWNNGSGIKYWQVKLNTTGHKNLRLFSKQRSAGTGPKDFKVQYKINANGAWTDLADATTIIVADNWTDGILSNVMLPAECENRTDVFIRWIMTGNSSVSGGNVASTALSYIDDIRVTGVLLNDLFYFQSKQNGNFNDPSTWKCSANNSTWTNASFAPTYKNNNITINNAHTVTITATVMVDQLIVNGTLIYADYSESVFKINDGTDVDLTINGTFEDNGPNSISWANNSTWEMSNHSKLIRTRGTSSDNWRDHYNNGISNIPASANWILRKTGSNNPSLLSTIDNNLVLTSGNLILGTNNITFSTVATVSNSSNASYIITNSTGKINKLFSALDSFTFPTGDANNYTPFSITLNSANFGSNATISSRVINSAEPHIGDVTDYINCYWNITSTDITNLSANVNYIYSDNNVTGIESKLVAVKWNNIDNLKFIGSVDIINNVVKADNITSLGNFTAANICINAIDIMPETIYSEPFYMSNTDTWLKFTALKQLNTLFIDRYNNSSPAVNKITLYKGDCENLIEINTINFTSFNDSICFGDTNFILNQIYYFKITRNENSLEADKYFKVYLYNENIPNYILLQTSDAICSPNFLQDLNYHFDTDGLTSSFNDIGFYFGWPGYPFESNNYVPDITSGYSYNQLAIQNNVNAHPNVWNVPVINHNGNTNFLAIDDISFNGTTTNPFSKLWSDFVTVDNTTTYTFSFYVKNLISPGGSGQGLIRPRIIVRINGVTVEITNISAYVSILPESNSWTQLIVIWSSNITGQVELEIGNEALHNGGGNDIAIDDIVFGITLPTIDPLIGNVGCSETSFSLNTNGLPSFQYQWFENTTLMTGQNSPFINISNTTTTILQNTYNVVATNGTCTATEQAVISWYAVPVAQISSTEYPICAPAILNVATGAGLTYEWFVDNVSIGTDASINAEITGGYYAIVTNTACSETSNVILVRPTTCQVQSLPVLATYLTLLYILKIIISPALYLKLL